MQQIIVDDLCPDIKCSSNTCRAQKLRRCSQASEVSEVSNRFDPLNAGSSARRRLIRGAFATPAVLTLTSGGALAATSSTQCLAAQVKNNPALPGVSSGDTWLRVQRYSKTLPAPYGLQYFVKGSDIVALRGTKTSISVYISKSQWQAVADNSGTLYETSDLRLLDPAPAADKGQFVAVRVNIDGNIIGIVGTNGSTGSAIAATCWMSFRAAP